MSATEEFRPKFIRKQLVFKRDSDGFFHGTVLGYIQDENDVWMCVVLTTVGTYLLVNQDTLEITKPTSELKSSKY